MSKIMSRPEYDKRKINNKKNFIKFFIVSCVLFICSTVFFSFVPTIDSWAKQLAEQQSNPVVTSLINAIVPAGKTIGIIFTSMFLIGILKLIKSFIKPKTQRGKTKVILYESIFKYSIVIIGFVLILRACGADVSSIVVSAGGVVVFAGLCLKSIVEDFVCGVIMVFEDNIAVGDIVSYSYYNFKGTVREIGTRVTLIENIHNDILIVNNSDIKSLVNHSRHTTRVIQTILLQKAVTQKDFLRVLNKNRKEIQSQCPDLIGDIKYYGILGYDRFNTQYAIEYYVRENRSLQTQKAILGALNSIFDDEGWLNSNSQSTPTK